MEMQSDPGHDLAHLDRVWATARSLADAATDLPVLLAASYLHDLVNLPKTDPERSRAARLSAKRAVPILRDLGLGDAAIAATQHAIEAHSFSAGITPKTPEAAILRDADRLDALGAIGLARWFAVSASMGTALYDPDDPFAQNRPLDDRQFALDHWRCKLSQLPGDMITAQGRALAQERAALMGDVLRQLGREIGHALPPDWAPSAE
ncbi:MAG: HD domain-containing protein [Rhodobacteraceae bacterium]|nr:HD domain-containing protein [Paracoccaceae bacterium]